MKRHDGTTDEQKKEAEVAAAVRDACVRAALNAYENARMDGLCHEGAWEAAVGAMRMLDLDKVVAGRSGEGW